MPVVIALIATIAAGAWLVALWSALGIVSLSPPGERMRNYLALGWWRFADLESRLGAMAIPHLRRYKTAFVIFFLSVLAGIGFGMLPSR